MDLMEREGLTVVGLPVETRWDALWVEVPKAWKRLLERHDEIESRASDIFVGVSLAKIGSVHHELVGAEVSSLGCVPEGMLAVEIPAQRYVNAIHDGPAIEIADTFGQMHGWARQRGLFLGAFKLDFGYTEAGGERSHDLFVGLLPETPWRAASPA